MSRQGLDLDDETNRLAQELVEQVLEWVDEELPEARNLLDLMLY